MNIILYTSGCYDDYSVYGLYVKLREFDTNDVIKDYIALYPDQAKDYCADYTKFTEYMVNNGYIQQLPYETFNLGIYDCFHMNQPRTHSEQVRNCKL